MQQTDFQRGNVLLVAKKYEEAIACFLRHAAECPRDAADALARIGECYKRHNVIAAPLPSVDGFTLVSEGNLRNSEYYYRLALKHDSRHFASLKGLAHVLPDGSEARLEILERIVDIMPDYVAFLELGHWHLSRSKCFERSYQLFLNAQKINPKDHGAYDGLQKVCRALGKMDEAAEWKIRWAAIYQSKRRLS